MKYIRQILAIVLLIAFISPIHAEEKGVKEGGIDLKEILFGHINDSYDWHIATINGHHVTLHLPVIVKSSSGWHAFCSSAFSEDVDAHGNRPGPYGLYISGSEENENKICEIVNGQEVRPLDISITKTAFSLMINSLILVLIIVGVSRWYKNRKPSSEAPKGFVGFIEMFIMSINDDVIKSSIGEKHYKFYAPYLLTAFFFIFISNLIGLVPVFPGGANLTGNIAITFFLAVCTFIAVNLFGNKHYWKDIFWPEVPTWLKFPVPMMPVVEFFGVFTKPFALMIRLFANILAGHAIVISLVCIIFITVQMGAFIGTSMTIVSVIMTIFMDFLELLVAFIQAYVFTMLSAVFIGLAHLEPKSE